MDENSIMGQVFKLAEQYLPDVGINDVFVEIGSDRGDGSTRLFAEMALKNQTVLHTVDINDYPQEWCEKHGVTQGVVWHQATGSEWAKDVFPTLNKKIVCLYLDNFDYNYNTVHIDPMIIEQQKQYREDYGIEMNNENCLVEHMKQMIALFPYMSEHSIVICDDTYDSNGCWIGKGGPIVTFLQAQGFHLAAIEAEHRLSYGVVLKR
jgi:hypothetical protein